LRLPGEFQGGGGTGSARSCRGARTTTLVLALWGLPSLWDGMERTEGAPAPLLVWKNSQQLPNPHQRCRVALRRFLATSATIGRIYAPGFDSANPQGVHSGSLEGFKSIGEVGVGETPALRAFLRAQRRELYYMYCSSIICIIYFILYNMCMRLVVQWRKPRIFHSQNTCIISERNNEAQRCGDTLKAWKQVTVLGT
jgi:hypothetical protein